MRRQLVRFVTLTFALLVLLSACGTDESAGDDDHWIDGSSTQTTVEVTPLPRATIEATAAPEPTEAVGDGLYPTVVDVEATTSDGMSWRFNVTLLSEYDSPARYADAWRVLDSDDNELGIRVLAHDHAGEQPFTRSTTVDVPAGVTAVYIEGRDQLNGWSGERYELILDR